MRLFLFFCVAALLLTTSCQKKISSHEKKQILRLNIHTEPPTLDARKATDTSSIAIIKMCFEGLMKRGRDGAIEPGIAQRIEMFNDNTLFIFHMREMNWWDGTPVTAHDFEHTWKTILDPLFPSGFAHDLYVLKNGMAAKTGKVSLDEVGVKALDDHTLQVELDRPIPYFLDLISCHSFLAVPKHITKEHSNWADESGELFVGNGPYKLTEWRHHNCMVLKKNATYWDQDLVTLDELQLTMIENEMTELHMFESGELDWAGHPLSTLPTDALQSLAQEQKLHTYPLCGTYYYIFNIQLPPFNNIHFRKAFALAINRTAIVNNITQSQEHPAMGYIPPTIWKVESHFKDNDIEEARRQFELGLSETGYTRNSLPTITLTYNTASVHHKIAQAIQEQWHKTFGIRVKLANKEWKVFLDELAHKQFQIARMGGIATFKDPMTFFELYKYPYSSRNFSGWTNSLFTHLLEEAEKCPDPFQRERLFRQAEKILMDEMPIIPIYYYTGTYIKKEYVKGVELTELSDADFKFAFVEMR